MQGGDIGVDWQHANWGCFRAGHAITGISASGVGSDLASDPDAVNKDLDVEVLVPQHASSLLWSKTFSGDIHASLGDYWVGALKWPNDGDLQKSCRRFDVRLSKRVNWLAKDDDLALTIQNFNSEHTEFKGFLVERRAFLACRVDF